MKEIYIKLIIASYILSYMKITYILFGTMFLLSTLACSRFDLPRIQEDQSIPQEILTPSPTPTLTINKEEHNNSDSENDINKTENKDMNESTQRDKLKEEISYNSKKYF